MKRILMTMLAVAMTCGPAYGADKKKKRKKKGGKKAKVQTEWKGPYVDVIVSSKISKAMGTYRRIVEEHEKQREEDSKAGAKAKGKKRKGNSKTREMREYWQEEHVEWVKRFEKLIKREAKSLVEKTADLERQLEKLAVEEEKFFENEAKMAEIRKKTKEITLKRIQYDEMLSEYMDFPNACWPSSARNRKLNNWSATNPFNTVAKSPSLDGTQIGDAPSEKYTPKAKVVIFTSLKHKPSLSMLSDLTSLISTDEGFPVSLVNVNVDQAPQSVEASYKDQTNKYLTLADSGKRMCTDFRIKFLPHVVILDDSAKIAEVYMAAVSADKSHMKGVLRGLKKGKAVKSRGIPD